MADGTVGVHQSSTADRLIDNEVVTNGNGTTVYRQRVTIGNQAGTWGYRAGTSGTPSIPAGARVLTIAAHSTTGGSMTVDGGNTITIPANSAVELSPGGNLVAPTIVLTGTDAYLVEYVT